MAADLDVRAVANFAALPEPTLHSLLDSPTTELVQSLLHRLQAKAQEYTLQKSQKTRLEVELETVVRTHESKVKVLQTSRDKALADVSTLRSEVQQADASRARAEAELDHVKQNHASDAADSENLKARVLSLESSTRDTLSLLDSKSAVSDRLAQDLQAEHQKVVDSRKQISALEQINQELTSAATTAKFRISSLEQELDSQRRNSDWYETELKRKADEHQKFRKEKNARVSELQQSNEQYIDQLETSRRTENSLKTRLEEQTATIDQLQRDAQRLRDQKIADDQNHRTEVDELRRLAQLQQEAANTARRRVEILELEREQVAQEIGTIRAEIQQEHEDREAAEQRVQELEVRVVDLESELEHARTRPQTPRREANGSPIATPLRPGTPGISFTPSSAHRFKNGLTNAQLYSEYTKLDRELATARRHNADLETQIENMASELENHKPEIDELRLDQQRLESEITDMSTLIDQANQQRDAVVKEARILQGQLDALRHELDEAQQSLRDRNSQVRWLLLEQQLAQSIDTDEYKRMEQAVRDADQGDLAYLSETQQDVNRFLVTFRNIEELQEKNARQGELIRNLTARFESEEALDRQQKILALEQQVQNANALVERYQDEIKSHLSQIDSYVKERDMLRNMLIRRGQLPSTDFSKSLPLSAGSLIQNTTADGASDYSKLLKDLQLEFDNYRQEHIALAKSLRDQVSELSQRNSQLQTDSSRSLGQLTASSQSYDMLKANYEMLKNENLEIQKRSSAAVETATKQELKTQQVAEELVEVRGQLDALRREGANLKAEKEWWKGIESRLLADNETLRNERSRTDQLNFDLQNLLNEREHSDSDTRRRLQGQVEALEKELHTTKRKLDEEVEETKKAALRRDYEREQSQKRIDDLVSHVNSTREELAAAKTTRDLLQAKVDEISIELRSAKERLDVLQRPTMASAEETTGVNDSNISKEQEQAIELSELKRDLELKTSELNRVQEDIEEYKNIASAAEERLQQFTETSEEEKASLQEELNRREARVSDLEQRLQDTSSELNDTTSQLSTMRNENAEFNSRLEDLKSGFESEIAQLKASEERARDEASSNLMLVQEQARIARESQENYEKQLVEHGQATEKLQFERARANKLAVEALELKSASENAKAALKQQEEKWSERESDHRAEVDALKARHTEIVRQKDNLQTTIETLHQQITSLQRDRNTTTSSEDVMPENNSSQNLDSLLENIKYLRGEKEILEIQYHESEREARRLQQKLDFAQSQLDETRLKLDQQRRADIDLERNNMEYNKLKETLNDLNIHRESNQTLRAELKQAQHALEEKSERVQQLEEELTPLKARIAELEHLLELRVGEMELLQKDRDSWQQRTQNILSKYDRIDPTELEELKAKVSSLEAERDSAVAAQEALQTQIDSHAEVVEAAKTDIKNRLGEQFKARNREMTGRVKDKQAELDTALAEKASLQTELEITMAELESTRIQLQTAQEAASDQPVGQGKETEVQPVPTSNGPDVDARVTTLEARVAELEAELSDKNGQISALSSDSDDKFKAKEKELKDILNKRLAEVKKEAQDAKQAALDELRESLETEHYQELEALRQQPTTTNQVDQNTAPSGEETAPDTQVVQPEEGRMTFAEFVQSITENQARTLVRENATIANILKTNLKKRVEEAKEALRKEIAAAQPEASSEEVGAQLVEIENKYAAEKEAIIRQKDEEFAAERDALVLQYQQESEEVKAALLEEQREKLQDEVEKAKASAEKMSAGKLKLITSQKDSNQAKLNVVKKAAEETPEKPVKEVWEIAKTAKPDAPKHATTTSAPTPAPSTTTVAAPAIPAPAAVAEEQPESLEVQNGHEPETNGVATEPQAVPVSASAGTAPSSNLPVKPPVAQASQLRQPSASGLPRGGAAIRGRGGQSQAVQPGGRGRGTGIPTMGQRGRGGPGRGTNRSASPSTNLNPTAQQFTPSGKRAREEGDGAAVDAAGAGQGKRIRSGGAAS